MKSLLGKLWLSITALVLVILSLLWLFQIGLLNTFYLHERQVLLADETDQLVSIIRVHHMKGDAIALLAEEVDGFRDKVPLKAILYDAQGKMTFFYPNRVAGFGPNRPEPANDGNNPVAERFRRKVAEPIESSTKIKSYIKSKQAFTLQLSSKQPNGNEIYRGVPIYHGGTYLGFIVVSTPIHPIEETISLLKLQLTIISLVSLLIGTLLAWTLARFFAKPIHNIIKVAKKIAAGDFSAKVTYKSNDEIGVLGNTINYMAKELGKTETLRRDLIANVSHELKTPLSLIRAYAELIEGDAVQFSPEDKSKYLQIIMDESDRLNKMIENMLYLSKMESGQAQINRTYFPMGQLLANVAENLHYLAQSKGQVLTVTEAAAANLYVHADRDKMYQVFYNIVGNAINNTPDHGLITLRLLGDEAGLRIEIEDNGKGISPEELPHIWDRFYKVDKSGQRDDSGTGLGMAIVKNILDLHGFGYGIDSNLGKGTTVWIEIDELSQQ